VISDLFTLTLKDTRADQTSTFHPGGLFSLRSHQQYGLYISYRPIYAP
jgi:hypothetical protein